MEDVIPEKNMDPNDHTLLLHNPIINKASRLRKDGNKRSIEGMEKLKHEGSVLIFQDPDAPSKTIMMEIIEINKDLGDFDDGITYRILSVKDGRLSRS